MSQPIRVEGWAYMPGARVSLRLQFRSQNSYARVKPEFHNPSGQIIRLEGVSYPREESGVTHTEVVLTGRVPESAALGTYECRSVQGLTGERNWAPIFEDPAFNIRVVERPFHAQRGEEFLGLEPAQRAESLKSPGNRAVATKEGNKSTHELTRRSSR